MPDGLRRTRPNILVLNNENPTWPERDRIGSREMLQTLLDGLSEQGYTFESYIYFDDLSRLDHFTPEDWLVWNWGEELGGRPWTEAEVATELERRGFAFTGSGATCRSPSGWTPATSWSSSATRSGGTRPTRSWS